MRKPSCHRHRRERTEEQQDKEALPSFCKIISSSIIADGQLGIPKKFFTKYGKYMSNVVVLKVRSCMAWRLDLRKVDGFACFQNGWKEFVEHYSICAGHYLVFRYDRKSQFDVIIFGMSGNEIDYSRSSNNLVESNHDKHVLLPENEGIDGNDGDDSTDNDDSSGRNLMTRRLMKTEERKGAIQIASPFKSKYPFFQITMQPSYVNAKYWPIPRTFSERYLPEGLESLSLQVPNGKKEWIVGCSLYSGIDIRIRKGLHLFMLENNIQIGDVCYFELIKTKNVVLKVTVIGSRDDVYTLYCRTCV
ncbi:B3 domain-containing transcription factor vrn1 [Thalictrum thalictroides]|uniref:B3 domain-containing transcription factor vrn1 n=1 Tax=Thalictrum thalictroides TaxID=46969 RepID=A0A7J6VQV1_THATH|nr:B3 domain-containing transcription factor vrn1 [Thalictrum thalictroides]